MLKKAGLMAITVLSPTMASAADIAMHRDPGCGCCEKWAEQVRQQFGRKVRIIDDANRGALQRRVGVPADQLSCHTAIVDGMASVFVGLILAFGMGLLDPILAPLHLDLGGEPLSAGLLVAFPMKLTNIATTQMSWWLR